jgi:threonine/homoserine/homoserine lactone efflux protein
MTGYTPQLILALTAFGFVNSITPGPNNTMLMASGANFGLRRTGPHLLGVVFGFAFLILCMGFGLGGLFHAYPILHPILRVLGSAYLLFLAYKLATAKGIGGGPAGGRPQTFLQAAAFQWINPKAWAMGVGAVSAYVPLERPVTGVLVMVAVFSAVNAPCVAAWAGFGVALRRFLDRPRVLKVFNWTMAVLLVVSLAPALLKPW